MTEFEKQRREHARGEIFANCPPNLTNQYIDISDWLKKGGNTREMKKTKRHGESCFWQHPQPLRQCLAVVVTAGCVEDNVLRTFRKEPYGDTYRRMDRGSVIHNRSLTAPSNHKTHLHNTAPSCNSNTHLHIMTPFNHNNTRTLYQKHRRLKKKINQRQMTAMPFTPKQTHRQKPMAFSVSRSQMKAPKTSRSRQI